MSNTWLTTDHLDALKALIPHITDRLIKRRVRECVLGLTADLNTTLMESASDLFADEPIVPLVESDLIALQTLMAKGIQHNGVAPELTTVEVTRSLQIMTELLTRAHAATLSLEDADGLAWIFDQAAMVDAGINRKEVRRVEQLVRTAMGIELRLQTMLPDYAPVH